MGGAGSDNMLNFFLCSGSLLRRAPALWAPKRRLVLVLLSHGGGLKGLEGLGAQAVYLFGKAKAVAKGWRVAGGYRFVVGTWEKPTEVFLGEEKGVVEAMELALSFEEELFESF